MRISDIGIMAIKAGPRARGQSALEYLTTYGWAILIIAIAVAALAALGLFTPSTYVSSSCIAPSNFSCLLTQLDTHGNFSVKLEQSTSGTINLTAIGCNNQLAFNHMLNVTSKDMPSSENFSQVLIGQTVYITGNLSEPLKCWYNNTVFAQLPNTLYHGYLIINYTNVQTGFPHTVVATLIEKVS